MFQFKGFTEKANRALNLAVESAQDLGHDYIGSEHLMLGLVKEGSGVAYTVLSKLGVTAEGYEKLLRDRIGYGEKTSLTPEDFTPRTKQILQIAAMAGARLHNMYVGTEHILIAILQDESCYAVRFLKILGVDPDRVARELSGAVSQSGSQEGERGGGKNGPALEQFGRDLTAQAKEGKIDPVIGRSEEIQRVIQILSRRTKNNPVLIGEPGVGKTAVAEGLALKISQGDVPGYLKRDTNTRHRRGEAGRRRDTLYRRAAHHYRRGLGGGLYGRGQYPEARAGPGRLPGDRGHNHQRVQKAYREGRGP